MCLSESTAGGEAAGWDVHLTALIVCVCVYSQTLMILVSACVACDTLVS